MNCVRLIILSILICSIPLFVLGQSRNEETFRILKFKKNKPIVCSVYIQNAHLPYDTLLHKTTFSVTNDCRTVNFCKISPESETRYSPTRIFCGYYPSNGIVFLKTKEDVGYGASNFNSNNELRNR